MSENEQFKVADDRVRGTLAVAQEWNCAVCGRQLVAGAIAVAFAAPPDGGPAELAPVLVDESCTDELRATFRNYGDAREPLGRAGDPAAAECALKAAVAVHRDAVNAVVEQATAPLHAAIREHQKEKAKLVQTVDQLRENVQEVRTKNRKWSEAFKRETASRQELEQRIKSFLETINVEHRYISRDELFAAAAQLWPQQAQAPAQG